VFVDGVDLAAISDAERTRLRCRKIGFVFQRFNLLTTLTVQGNVEIARQIYGGKPMSRQEVGDLLRSCTCGKSSTSNRSSSRSGTAACRIARALVNERDPPRRRAHGNLDSRNSEQVLRPSRTSTGRRARPS
jgi:putative ABC transport system ATP-binding protein